MIEERTVNILEFDTVLSEVAQYAVSDVAKTQILSLRPASTIEEIEHLLQLTADAYTVRYKYNDNPIVAIDDCIASVEKAKIGGTLQCGELLKVARLLRSARLAKSVIARCGDDVEALRTVVGCAYPDHALETEIGNCIASDSEVKDDASVALRTIRRRIATANIKIKNRLDAYLREDSKYLQDTLVTVRDGRFVLPVKSESRSAIPGLVHDTSGSGATVFVEPFPIVEMNNVLRELQAEERDEIERILYALSCRVGELSEMLILCQKQCVMLDIIFAKMAYSVQIRGVRPVLNINGILNLKDARHPLIKKEQVVPVSLELGESYRILMITGPNTGGKTVCLKTAGLLCLMAYTGIFVPCAETSQIAVFDTIFCDIGDAQSIEQSLSTFSSHVVNLVAITDAVTDRSLVLLDELGGGTDPNEGAALAQGILRYLEQVGARGIVTTHYGALKEYSLISDNLMNASMQFDENTLRPTYKILLGVPGVSNALKIAESLGLNRYILQQAKNCLKNETVQFEQVLASAERIKAQALADAEASLRLKQEWEAKCRQQELDSQKLQAKLEKINSNAKAETLRLVGAARDEADEIIEQMKALMQKADEAALLEARKLRNRLEDMHYLGETRDPVPTQPLGVEEIRPGVRAYIKSIQTIGTIQSLPDKKGKVSVAVGSVNMTVSVNDLGRENTSPDKAVKRGRMGGHAEKRRESGEEKRLCEIKVLGLTVAEAIDVIEPYILDIANDNDRILKIVHGKGTGALGKGIQKYLHGNAHVASYRYGKYGEGETGVTVVEIK